MPDLTPREKEVAGLTAEGFQVSEIAAQLGISPYTVKIHRRAIYAKLGVRNAVLLALALAREAQR